MNWFVAHLIGYISLQVVREYQFLMSISELHSEGEVFLTAGLHFWLIWVDVGG
jgi:hypothetical protein